MKSTTCDVLVLGDGPVAQTASVAAARTGADTLLLSTGDIAEDVLLAAVLAAQERHSGVQRLAAGDVRRIVRHGRSLVAIVRDQDQVQAHFFVDASESLQLLTGAGVVTNALPAIEPLPDREFIDTIAVYDTPGGRCALPYSAALIPALDNALAVPRGGALPAALAIAGAHAVGVAAALLAASGQPAAVFDSATLRERLRDAGARL